MQSGGVGELGNGAYNSSDVPVLVSGGHAFAAISAGFSHTCAITANGSLLCWGEPPGNGQRPSPYAPINEPEEPTWASGSNAAYVGVATGADFTCVLDSSSDTHCFGECT